MSVIGPLAASSLSNMNAKSAHAHLLRSRHSLRENGRHIDVVRQCAVIELLVKRGETRHESSTSDFVVCIEMLAGVPAGAEIIDLFFTLRRSKVVPVLN
jgi:hypothetical protein